MRRGLWTFSKNKPAARSQLTQLSQPASVERMVVSIGGFDVPPLANFTTFKVWAEAGPPMGTLYHYPNPHDHQTLSIVGAPAPPSIAMQIASHATMTQMVARYWRGQPLEQVMAWAEGELEGFTRT
jgi:hypothetical protein